jgi:tetratricopeptide (TPR) repeat protein
MHDTRWRPGTARDRLPVIDEMLAAAADARDREMRAQARLLRAAALIELGDPDGPTELSAYCRQCEELGHARARYGALSRRATAALIAGDIDRAAELARSAYELGQAIGEADTRGVYETLVAGIERAGGDPERIGIAPDARLDSEPWPGLPLIEAYEHLVAGDLAAAGRALEQLNLDDLPPTYDLELLTFAADTVAAAGTAEQRSHMEQLLQPYAGLHIVVGGCAAYCGAVDHYLGILARSLGRTEDARRHFTSAAAMHERLGAPGWAEYSRRLGAAGRSEQREQAGVFRRDGDIWTITFRGTESHLPDSKGLRDLAVLLVRPGESVHAVELHTGRPPQTGADEVLDDRAKAAYRRRLADLESDIDQAEADHDTHRGEKARAERDALITELSAAAAAGSETSASGAARPSLPAFAMPLTASTESIPRSVSTSARPYRPEPGAPTPPRTPSAGARSGRPSPSMLWSPLERATSAPP